MLSQERPKRRRKLSSKLVCTELLDTKVTGKPGTSQNGDSIDFSQETIDSTIILPFEAKTWHDVKSKLESIAWIQCDNQSCQKWRKIAKQELETLHKSDKWFCHQNSDKNFNSCEIAEEDVDFYDQLALRSGLKYLKSQLEPGSLVWAKMHGYCSWPAVVTPEPKTDNGHLWQDAEGEITQYHVEFLGKPHSHGWVFARDIRALTRQSINQQVASSQQDDCSHGRKQQKKRGRSLGFAASAAKLKTTYKNVVSVEHAVAEALELLPFSPLKRLKKCFYVSKDFSESKTLPSALTSTKNTTTAVNSSEAPAPCSSSLTTPDCNFTLFESCLHDRSKEERLMLDIEMYKRNERAFEHDVTRFLIRNGLKTCKGPIWQNQNISIFQLFLAVHERGGYDQVTKHRCWAAVYREVTDLPCDTGVQNSQAAKIFYQRFLYPYELYIHGKNFRDFVPYSEDDSTVANRKKTSHCRGKQNSKPRHNDQKITAAGDDSTAMEEDVASDSLMQMLQVLEENSKLALETLAVEDKIDITFYDESTPSRDCLPPLTDYEQVSPQQFVPSLTKQGTYSKNTDMSSSHNQPLEALSYHKDRLVPDSGNQVCHLEPLTHHKDRLVPDSGNQVCHLEPLNHKDRLVPDSGNQVCHLEPLTHHRDMPDSGYQVCHLEALSYHKDRLVPDSGNQVCHRHWDHAEQAVPSVSTSDSQQLLQQLQVIQQGITLIDNQMDS